MKPRDSTKHSLLLTDQRKRLGFLEEVASVTPSSSGFADKKLALFGIGASASERQSSGEIVVNLMNEQILKAVGGNPNRARDVLDYHCRSAVGEIVTIKIHSGDTIVKIVPKEAGGVPSFSVPMWAFTKKEFEQIEKTSSGTPDVHSALPAWRQSNTSEYDIYEVAVLRTTVAFESDMSPTILRTLEGAFAATLVEEGSIGEEGTCRVKEQIDSYPRQIHILDTSCLGEPKRVAWSQGH